KRLMLESPAYNVLHDWMRQGMAGPRDNDPVLSRLDVQPGEAIVQAGKSLALQVRALGSDGKTRDVTEWALFESNKDSVASVSAQGEVRAGQPGRAAIMVRYLGHAVAVSVTVPTGAGI